MANIKLKGSTKVQVVLDFSPKFGFWREFDKSLNYLLIFDDYSNATWNKAIEYIYIKGANHWCVDFFFLKFKTKS